MENLCCVGFATFLKMLSTDPLRKIPKFFFFISLSHSLSVAKGSFALKFLNFVTNQERSVEK